MAYVTGSKLYFVSLRPPSKHCWPTAVLMLTDVEDGGPTLEQHWVKVSCCWESHDLVMRRSAQRVALRGIKVQKLGVNLNSTRPPLMWSAGHITKGETMIFLRKPHAGSAGFEPGTRAWLAGIQAHYQSATSPPLWSSDHVNGAFNFQCSVGLVQFSLLVITSV